MDLEGLYARLPIPLQNVATSLEGWRIHRSRYSREFHGLLADYRGRDDWDGAKLRQFRDRRLAAFVEHAARTVPYYRDLFAEAGLVPGDVTTVDDLPRLPLLTKAMVQDGGERFFSETVPPSERFVVHTSGSTGAGLRFPVTYRAHSEQWAVWWRYRMRHGLPLDEPCLYMGGRSVVPLTQRRPPFWRYNRPGRQILFSGYHLSRENAAAYLAEMRRSGWRWLHGYPSLVALLAGYALELGKRVPLRWISLGSEGMLPQQRALIESAFGVPPIIHYGMAEGVASISLLPEGGYVVDEDYAAVEFVPREDGRHEIVGTNFSNPAFPLIRYRTDDVATLPASSPAGDGARAVAQVDGRREDFIITRSGARLGRLDHVFKDMINIREAQIRQQRAGEMTLCIVRGPRYTEADEKLLEAETRKRVGDDVRFTIEYRDALERTRRGKLRFVVSEVDAGRLNGTEGS